MISFRTAKTEEDLYDAQTLIQRVYAREGYVREFGVQDTDFASFFGKEHTKTIVAYMEDALQGTISVVTDGPHGLPMDCIYKDAVDPK